MLKPIRVPKRITNLDSRIFANLMKANRPLSVKRVAQRVGISWPTAKAHVNKLQKFNVLTINKTIRKNRVEIDPRFLKKTLKFRSKI